MSDDPKATGRDWPVSRWDELAARAASGDLSEAENDEMLSLGDLFAEWEAADCG